ncbi:hypothetical protein B0A52_01441 [Exophiala mesophila]|uniref:Uncharacterized protein n=1 Tax=Exophiala mesophila TaxID=212818 RepID=A0A438NF07_EXOME|nr:hypothetical protein B0A52_01441 [Exophiala mesophila]
MDIASLVRAVLAAFEDGSKLVQRIRDRRAKPGREPLPEGPTNDLLDSLTLGPMLVRGHYDHDVKRFGEQYTCGDGQAREQMKDVLINLQMKLIIALRTVMMDEMELDFDALQTASDDGRVNTGVCLGQLSQRLSSNLQAQAHYPTHRVSSYASSSTSTSAPTLPISSSLNYSTSQSTHSSGTFPSPPKTESLPDRSMSVVVRLSSPSPPPSSEPQQQEQEQEQEPEREEEPEPETEPLQEEPVELGDVSESEQPRVVEDAEVSNQPTPETNADHTLIVPVPLDQQSLDETNRDLENANRKSTHILASEDKGILLLFPQPGGHPKLATPLEQKQEEGQVASEHQDPPTQGRTHQSTGSRERFSPDDYQDEKMSPDDIHYKLNLGKQYSPSIRTIASQYSHSTIYDMYHHQQQQQPAPPPIDASVEAGRVMSSISSSSSSSSSAAPAPALAPPEAVVAKPLPQSTSTPPTTSQSSRPLYHSSPDYVRYLQENSRPPRSQPRTEPTTSTDKPRGKKILGKFHAAPQDIPYRPTARLARPVVINRAPEKDGAGDNKTSVVVVPIPTTAPPPRTGGWHVHPPSRSSSRPNHPVVVAGAVEVDAPHRHVHKTPPSPYRPPLRPLPPPPLPPSLPLEFEFVVDYDDDDDNSNIN